VGCTDLIVATAIPLTLVACSVGDVTTLEHEGKLSSNGLVLRSTAVQELSTAPLAVRVDEELHFAEENFPNLLSAQGGTQLAKYLATCSLEAGEELTLPDGQIMHGLLGLAPEWSDGPCDEECQGWVTACILAHANALGEPTRILLQGDHPALEGQGAYNREFMHQEGAYFGNMFAPSEQALLLGCVGTDLWEIFETPGLTLEQWMSLGSTLDEKVCADPDACAFQFTGLCRGMVELAEEGFVDAAACETSHERSYSDCSVAPVIRDMGYTATPPVHRQVVTIYLDEAGRRGYLDE